MSQRPNIKLVIQHSHGSKWYPLSQATREDWTLKKVGTYFDPLNQRSCIEISPGDLIPRSFRQSMIAEVPLPDYRTKMSHRSVGTAPDDCSIPAVTQLFAASGRGGGLGAVGQEVAVDNGGCAVARCREDYWLTAIGRQAGRLVVVDLKAAVLPPPCWLDKDDPRAARACSSASAASAALTGEMSISPAPSGYKLGASTTDGGSTASASASAPASATLNCGRLEASLDSCG